MAVGESIGDVEVAAFDIAKVAQALEKTWRSARERRC
jgi:hypothetical protein